MSITRIFFCSLWGEGAGGGPWCRPLGSTTDLCVFCRERVRVVVSVWSDCVGAAVADKLTRGEQELLNYRNSQYRLLKYDMMDTVKEADYV